MPRKLSAEPHPTNGAVGNGRNYCPVHPDITPFYPPSANASKHRIARGVRTARAGFASLQLAPTGDRLAYDFIPDIAEVAFADQLNGFTERMAREITLHSYFGYTYQSLVRIGERITGDKDSRTSGPVAEMLDWIEHHPFRSELPPEELVMLITRRPDISHIYRRLALVEPERKNRVWVEPEDRLRAAKPVVEKPPTFPRGSDLTEPQIRTLDAYFAGNSDGTAYAVGHYPELTRLVFAEEIAMASDEDEAREIVKRKVGSAFTFARRVEAKLADPATVNGELPPNIKSALERLGVSREVALKVVRRQISYPALQQEISGKTDR